MVVHTITSNAANRKRAADDEEPRSARKRQNTEADVDEAAAVVDKAQLVHECKSFKFLGLPAELRNQIYGYAVDYCYRSFPMLHKKPKKIGKRWLSHWVTNPTSPPNSGSRPFPYVALTQVCMQIRAEFRPMWLSTHRLPLSFVDMYLKAFFPVRTSPALARFKPRSKTAVSLRIWVRKDDLKTSLNSCDATRLFKHKARFPDCTIVCTSGFGTEDQLLRDLERVINHDDPVWRKAVSGGRISQVRLSLDIEKKVVILNAVVKERFAEPWMKVISAKPPEGAVEKFLKHYGFEAGSWRARVSVDYS